jgi:hypothetical protein
LIFFAIFFVIHQNQIGVQVNDSLNIGVFGSAAQNKHIYTVDGSLLSWHGTRIALALQELPPIFDRIKQEKNSRI